MWTEAQGSWEERQGVRGETGDGRRDKGWRRDRELEKRQGMGGETRDGGKTGDGRRGKEFKERQGMGIEIGDGRRGKGFKERQGMGGETRTQLEGYRRYSRRTVICVLGERAYCRRENEKVRVEVGGHTIRTTVTVPALD